MSTVTTKRLDLKNPVQLGEKSEPVTFLEFSRQLKARDFKGMPTPIGMDEQMMLLSRLTEQPLPIIHEMSAGDLMAAIGILNNDFL